MPNVSHANLTGANLHEPKGADAAAANKVYLSNGAGSGAWTFPAGAAYGELYITGGATSQTLSAASAYARLDPGTAWDSGGSLNTTLTPDDGTITVSVAGVYMVTFHLHFTTAALAAGTGYFFKVATNGTPVTRIFAVDKVSAGADDLNVAGSSIITFAANDIVSIHCAGDGTSSSTAITPKEASLSVVLLKAS